MKNWKTTLVGLGTGLGYAVLTGLQSGLKGKDLIISLGLALLGAFSKDHDVTGVGMTAERK